jgi:hypothetical protein
VKKQEVSTEEKNVEESRSAYVFQKRSCEVIPDNTGEPLAKAYAII